VLLEKREARFDELRGEREGVPLSIVLLLSSVVDLLEFGALTQEDISKCLRETGLDETDEAYQLSFTEYSEFADKVDELIDIVKLDLGMWLSASSNHAAECVDEMRFFSNELSLRSYQFVSPDDIDVTAGVEKAYKCPIEFRLLNHWDDCSCGGWRHWMPLFKAEGRWRWNEARFYPEYHK